MTRLDELVRVVLAPNPSPMTLDGTNTYLVSRPGSGEALVIDPGPDREEHRRTLEAALGAADADVAAVLVTHHHADHAEAAIWAAQWGAPLLAHTPALVPGDARALADGQVLRRGGASVQAVHTPGHASDHLCLRIVETDVVLTGDHVLGRGSTVVLHPDGDMADYLASLQRLRALGATSLYPGHGPVIEHPPTVIDEYLAHRRERERQVLAALSAAPQPPAAIVARLYADVDARLHAAAERSVRAHLAKLEREGRVRRVDSGDAFALAQPA
jgi:glyoxylase-like metal-dependent hydrolase (beta-lactamase superfamily II)